MDNIFENCEFGTRLKTRDGRDAIYVSYGKWPLQYKKLYINVDIDVHSVLVRTRTEFKDGTFIDRVYNCIYKNNGKPLLSDDIQDDIDIIEVIK